MNLTAPFFYGTTLIQDFDSATPNLGIEDQKEREAVKDIWQTLRPIIQEYRSFDRERLTIEMAFKALEGRFSRLLLGGSPCCFNKLVKFWDSHHIQGYESRLTLLLENIKVLNQLSSSFVDNFLVSMKQPYAAKLLRDINTVVSSFNSLLEFDPKDSRLISKSKEIEELKGIGRLIQNFSKTAKEVDLPIYPSVARTEVASYRVAPSARQTELLSVLLLLNDEEADDTSKDQSTFYTNAGRSPCSDQENAGKKLSSNYLKNSVT